MKSITLLTGMVPRGNYLNAMKSIFLYLPVSIILCCCGSQKTDQQAEGMKIMDLSREWAKSAGTDNLEQTLSYWSDDAICLFILKAPTPPATR